MNTKQAKEIVPPEPHADFRKAWNYMPRWVQVVVVVAFVLGGILVVIFMR